ncbi:U-box domain-containing protein 33-like isoform X1 [Andrographis paniculata]|uniref:U-box domain-containing protein 33-like isoform X1 n=1 Tax=Andrographis paniculata TaxID=175694 RepID=UPI0021E7DA91|nr:U-box domain-containing protein 33-like isoform X1 [Andrographis paniculata]
MERDGEEGRNHDQSTSTSEIVEIPGEDGSKIADPETKDVYVAVGKNDLHVLEWALDHVVPPGSRVLLVHIFAPIAYIPTQVGRLSRSQLSQEQLKVYVREESNKRNHLLGKYISRCGESKVAVDTMLVESHALEKAILELIPVVNITHLVMGAKHSTFSRLSRKGASKGEYIQKHAPEYCHVTLVYNGKKSEDGMDGQDSSRSLNRWPQVAERHFLECICFSGKLN